MKRVENMTDSHLLRFFIEKNGDTIGELAAHLEIQRSTLSAKINNRRDFRQTEMFMIGRRYNLSMDTFAKIFLCNMTR